MSRLARLLIVAAGLAAGGVAAADSPPPASPAPAPAEPVGPVERDGEVVERAELTVAPSKRPIRSVVIDNQLGDIKVEGHDGDVVSIVSVKHAPDPATLERMRVTLVPDPDGTVRLTTNIADARERRPAALATLRIDLTIRVPRSARVEGRVGRGSLEVANVDAGAELDAGAGKIAVRNVAGAVRARSVDGDQRFEDVFGSIEAHAIDGDVALDTVRGAALDAQVYDGDIEGRHIASREVRLYAIRGNIRVATESQPGGVIVVTSLRGKVDVHVRAIGRLAVRARAGGTLSWAGPAATPGRWIDSQFGQAGQAGSNGSVRLESRYGDVAFTLLQ
ncbi:MAG TPA: DUF4097 family beta strand repeat-containing protein [Kofleriaceae bacterium]|jgi:hypothetical protein|nr:DUF4097 family beta strand repeat-containing protein [Kofleriaceae bacterium]